MVGIDAPKVGELSVLDRSAFIVERFDRDRSTEIASRIHVEDFAQASGLRSQSKYFLAAHQAVEMLRTADPTDELGYQFMERLAFNVSVANCDAHAKNYSLFINSDSISLAPIYDALVIGFWPQFDVDLAMRIGDAQRSVQVTLRNWEKLAIRSKLAPDRVANIAAQVSSRVLDAAADAFAFLPSSARDSVHRVLKRANKNMPSNQPNWKAPRFSVEEIEVQAREPLVAQYAPLSNLPVLSQDQIVQGGVSSSGHSYSQHPSQIAQGDSPGRSR
jgi:serine/threonine-protein kinase HipA